MGLIDRFLSRLRSRVQAPGALVGCWHLVRAEGELDTGDEIEMEFKPDGELTYAIAAGDRWGIVRLTYRVEGNTIVTDQPSEPHEERSRFRFEGDGTLMLEQGESRAWYCRGQRRVPAGE